MDNPLHYVHFNCVTVNQSPQGHRPKCPYRDECVTSQPKSSPPHAELGSFPRFWCWHGTFIRLWFVPIAIPANFSWSQTQWLKHSVVQHISSCLVFGGNQATFPLLFTWFPPKSVKWPELLQSTNSGSVSSIYTFICSVWGKSFKSLLQKPNAEPEHGWKKTQTLRSFPFLSCWVPLLLRESIASRRRMHRCPVPLLSIPVIAQQSSIFVITIPCKTTLFLLSWFTPAIPVTSKSSSQKDGRPHIA